MDVNAAATYLQPGKAVAMGSPTGAGHPALVARVAAADERRRTIRRPHAPWRLHRGKIDYLDIHPDHVARFAPGLLRRDRRGAARRAAVLPATRGVPSTLARIDATWRELIATVVLKVNADRPVVLHAHARHRCLRR